MFWFLLLFLLALLLWLLFLSYTHSLWHFIQDYVMLGNQPLQEWNQKHVSLCLPSILMELMDGLVHHMPSATQLTKRSKMFQDPLMVALMGPKWSLMTLRNRKAETSMAWILEALQIRPMDRIADQRYLYPFA